MAKNKKRHVSQDKPIHRYGYTHIFGCITLQHLFIFHENYNRLTKVKKDKVEKGRIISRYIYTKHTGCPIPADIFGKIVYLGEELFSAIQ